MSRYNTAEAGRRLSFLIDCALRGETVVITRNGRPVAKLTPISSAHSVIVQRLMHRPVGSRRPREDAVAAVRRVRDEWTR